MFPVRRFVSASVRSAFPAALVAPPLCAPPGALRPAWSVRCRFILRRGRPVLPRFWSRPPACGLRSACAARGRGLLCLDPGEPLTWPIILLSVSPAPAACPRRARRAWPACAALRAVRRAGPCRLRRRRGRSDPRSVAVRRGPRSLLRRVGLWPWRVCRSVCCSGRRAGPWRLTGCVSVRPVPGRNSAGPDLAIRSARLRHMEHRRPWPLGAASAWSSSRLRLCFARLAWRLVASFARGRGRVGVGAEPPFSSALF